jgi:hypothetical protein
MDQKRPTKFLNLDSIEIRYFFFSKKGDLLASFNER